MQIIKVPHFLVGDNPDDVNIFFYNRADGPDQIKLKINYEHNMLVFMVKGRKELFDETKSYEINNDQLGLVASGNMLMNERVTLRSQFKSLLLFFTNDYLQNFIESYDIVLNRKEPDHVKVISIKKDEYLSNFQDSMLILEKKFRNKNFRRAKLDEILLYLCDKHPVEFNNFLSLTLSKRESSSLSEIIRSHMFQNMTSEELAYLCNMSTSTFRRRFQEIYDTTPKRYFISQKMKQAAFLLQSRKRPSEFYNDLGYENLSSFSLEFKKHYGVPPTSYVS